MKVLFKGFRPPKKKLIICSKCSTVMIVDLKDTFVGKNLLGNNCRWVKCPSCGLKIFYSELLTEQCVDDFDEE